MVSMHMSNMITRSGQSSLSKGKRYFQEKQFQQHRGKEPRQRVLRHGAGCRVQGAGCTVEGGGDRVGGCRAEDWMR